MKLGDSHLRAPTLSWEYGPPDPPADSCPECGALPDQRHTRGCPELDARPTVRSRYDGSNQQSAA